MFIASEAFRVESATTKGFATGESREEAANSTTIAGLTKAHGNTQAMAGGDDHAANRQAQHAASESEFERLLDVAEAARLLRIHPKTLRAKAGHGIIPGIQIGRVWRFRATIRDYLRHSNPHVTNKYLQATPESKRLAQGKLVDAILPGGLLSGSKLTLIQ
jgi:hypothetical protein